MFLKQLFLVIISSSLLASSAHIAARDYYHLKFDFLNNSGKTIFVTVQQTGCAGICGKIFHPSYTNLCCDSKDVSSGSEVNLNIVASETQPKIFIYDGESGKLLNSTSLPWCKEQGIDHMPNVTLDSSFQIKYGCNLSSAAAKQLKQKISQSKSQPKK